ncbi:MAG TPA: hypothetical protein VKM55_00745 [Candidatus Lokiarchaeia archaeon]|nr:hypothetical protein [Candidatus Lokiarchaeia archaeon]
MASAALKKARIKCPACQRLQDVDIPEDIFERVSPSGIVTISFKTDCGHYCQAFVDKNFQIRGEACADVSLDELKEGTETPEMIRVSDLVVKLASEVIKINVQYSEIIKKIGAQKIVDALEKALILCKIQDAITSFDQLLANITDAGEMSFAVQLRKEIMWLNGLVKSRNGFDWSSIEMCSLPEIGENEYAHMKGVQYERLQQIFTTLEFGTIEHELSQDAVDMKKTRLVDMLDKMI